MIITEKQECEHKLAKECYICNQEFTPDDWKVRDHDHFTGLYRGPAHNTCNLRKRKRKHIPLLFHNSNCDLNLFVREFAKFPEYDIKILPRNTEKFISVSITKILEHEWAGYRLICNHVLTTGSRKGEHCGRNVSTKYFEDTTKCEAHVSESIRDEIFCECCENRAVKGYIRCSECLYLRKEKRLIMN